MREIRTIFLTICVVSGLVTGCDPVTVHKVTSTVFDGVPSLPPADQYCQEYYEAVYVKVETASTSAGEEKKGQGSKHEPYAEKRCDDCHDKAKESGLISPPEKLCFLCHTDILSGPNLHGPAAVGGCLECHEPHSSAQPALLKMEKSKLCSYCHKEERIASSMHQRVTSAGIACTECHDPHAGNGSYFFKWP